MKKFLLFSTTILLSFILLTGCRSQVLEPEIKEGKFNFCITYELNGMTSNFSGVYVCQYAGISWYLDGGYQRDWTSYIEGAKENDYDAIIGTTADGDKIIIATTFYPEYFMADPNAVDREELKPQLFVIQQNEAEQSSSMLFDEEIIEKDYHAKIIEVKYDEPIKNNFR